MYVLLYFFVLYCIAGFATSLFYHRILSHRVLTFKPMVEKFFFLLALPAGTPIQWVGTHRKHHAFTDQKEDPHSPVQFGFWFAHCGWYLGTNKVGYCVLYAFGGPLRMLFDAFWRPRSNQENNIFADDIAAKPFAKWISKPVVYTSLMLLYLILLIGISWLLFGLGKGLFLLWASLVVIYNLGDAVNSLTHRQVKAKRKSTVINIPFLALFTFGEAYHSEHHKNPTLSTMNPMKLSLGKLMLFLLKNTGLAKTKSHESIR